MMFDAYSVNEFCDSHRISRAYFYRLKKRGQAPQTMKVGSRTLISREAAARWRLKMESAANAA
jgi:predicted DNA-binding transcriptional regulator AlpA